MFDLDDIDDQGNLIVVEEEEGKKTLDEEHPAYGEATGEEEAESGNLGDGAGGRCCEPWQSCINGLKPIGEGENEDEI